MKGLIMPGFDGDGCDKETLHFLYGLVGYLKPALIVEAGTYRGAASCVMAAAIRDFSIDGEIWTADVEGYDAAGTVAANGFGDIVHLYRGDFVEMLNGPLANRYCRMAFIDSGRVVVGVDLNVPTDIRQRHYLAVIGKLIPGGVAVIDDVAGSWVGVEALREQASVCIPTGRGVALVQRR